ncbi:hypothetical protein AB4524_00705 [Vibrio breoganii]
MNLPTKAEMLKDYPVKPLVTKDVQAGIPSRDQTEFTESEQSIAHNIVRKVFTPSLQGLQQDLSSEETLRDNINLDKTQKNIDNANVRLEQNLERHFDDSSQSLKSKGTNYAQIARSLRLFKDSNNLDRAASYPESKVLHYAFIAMILIVETMLNSSFLAEGSELGLIGGFFSALVIAVVNTLFAFITASVIRYVFHVNKGYKISAIASLVLIFILLTCFILLVGHYRDSLQSDPFQASRLAIASFTDNPFGIEDFNAWVLVAISWLAFSVLVLKFLFADDLYPGFGKLSRDEKVEQENWIESCESLGAKANKIIEDSQVSLANDQKKMRTDFNKYKSSLERSDKLVSNQFELQKKTQKLLDDLILDYQSQSEKILHYRADYFGKKLLIEQSEFETLDVASLESHRQDLPRLQSYIDVLDEKFSSLNLEIDETRKTIQTRVKDVRITIERQLGIGEVR